MKKNWIHKLPMLLTFAFLGIVPAQAQEKAPQTTTPVQMTVTLNVLGENKRMPEVSREDVIVRQGRERLEVTGWEPLREGNTGLDLFVLIDDASNPVVGSQFDDLRSFINAQPLNTKVGIGYMRNGTVQIAQDFTTNHDQAAKALRLPMASSGAYGNPYLSVIDLMKRWPDDSKRREVVMVTDGIDRFRSTQRYRGLRTLSPDVDSASRVAQRTGTTINSIFTRGVGRLANNYWEITNGQNGMAKLAEETGGQSFYLGTQNPVSFKPYLDDLQKSFDNKYVLEFRAIPGQKSGPQYVKLSTEVAGVELDSADSVWVNAR
ncbi:MAG TPA: hypothetical protein VHX49_17250 [Candidatus Acidoferrales bacterium]|jgi:hypothetical protein|nr:hypothetical protein [Candidatus Acidoferrales bacterium]